MKGTPTSAAGPSAAPCAAPQGSRHNDTSGLSQIKTILRKKLICTTFLLTRSQVAYLISFGILQNGFALAPQGRWHSPSPLPSSVSLRSQLCSLSHSARWAGSRVTTGPPQGVAAQCGDLGTLPGLLTEPLCPASPTSPKSEGSTQPAEDGRGTVVQAQSHLQLTSCSMAP